MIDWFKRKKAIVMHHIYRFVTNKAMSGSKWARALVLYRYDVVKRQGFNFTNNPNRRSVMTEKTLRVLQGVVYGVIAISLLMVADVHASENNSYLHGSLNTNNNNTTTQSNSNNDSSVTEVNGDTYSGSSITNVRNANQHTSSAISPTITSGYDTCATGNSGAVQTPGWGLSFGKNEADETCERLKLAKMMLSMGMKDAAAAIMMQDDRVYQAILVAYPVIAEKFGQAAQKAAQEKHVKK